jgi:glutathione S-transferase
MRWFIKNITTKFFSVFYSTKGMSLKSEEEQKAIRGKVDAVLAELEDNIEGPYAVGEQFTLADIMVFPWIKRWVAQKEVYGIDIPAKHTKIHQLKALVEQRPSAQEVRKESSDEFLLSLYRSYLHTGEIQ